MVTTPRSPLAERTLSRSRRHVQAVFETVSYLGCTIIVRSEVTANGIIAGSYEVTAADGKSWVFVGGSDDLPERSDPQYLLEVAKCEIDFALEVEF